MKRSLVILPGSFSGPWAFGFANPMVVWRGPEKHLAVFVTDVNISIPSEGQELEIKHSDTLNQVLERAGFTRTRPEPPPVVLPPPVVISEPVVIPPPEVIPEPVVVYVELAPEPVVVPRVPRKKPSAFSRIKSFFKRK